MAGVTTANSAVVTLPSDTQILITRVFDAPRQLVYRAYTTPELIRRWWAGDRGEVRTAEVDLRPGGSWRYVMTANAGFEVAFHGEYQEIIPGERIVATEIYEGAPDAAAVTTTTFTEHDGRTTLSILVQHISRENRDMHLNSGMEAGMQESMNHLEQVARAGVTDIRSTRAELGGNGPRRGRCRRRRAVTRTPPEPGPWSTAR